MKTSSLTHPNGKRRLGDILQYLLQDPQWIGFRAAIAFVKYSGVKHVKAGLLEFSKRGHIRISVGIDSGGTSVEGLTHLLHAMKRDDEIYVFHNEASSTFHPKVYVFKSKKRAHIFIGSSNLTEGGLYTNYESSLELELDLTNKEDMGLLATIEASLDIWATPAEGLCYRLDEILLSRLAKDGEIPYEADTTESEVHSTAGTKETRKTTSKIFKRTSVQKAPFVKSELPKKTKTAKSGTGKVTKAKGKITEAEHLEFYMTLQRTDVGRGQVTLGAQQRSPEIFIPLAARDADPEFWGWPDKFVQDKNWAGPVDGDGHGKMDRSVQVRFGTEVITARIWYNPDKRDIRIRSESLRSAGDLSDILRIERLTSGSGPAYFVEVIPKDSTRFPIAQSLCVNKVGGISKKAWGYV